MFTLTMKNTPALQTNSITEDHHRKTCWCIRVGEAPEVSSRATPPPSWTAAEEEAKHILRYFRSVTQSSRSSLITVIFVIIDIILGFRGEEARVSRMSLGGSKSLIHRYFEKRTHVLELDMIDILVANIISIFTFFIIIIMEMPSATGRPVSCESGY